MRATRGLGIALVGVLLFAASASADSGYEDDDLSLRLASAFIRFTEVSSFGGESAANRWSPAVNPASADWTRVDSRTGIVLAGYWSHIDFDEGTTIDLLGETGLWDTRRAGTVHLTLSQVRSNEATDKTGLEFDYETDTFQVQWAKRFGRVAAGLAFNYAESEVVQSSMGFPVRSSEAETYRFRAGALWCPSKRWLVGVVGEYGWSPFDFEAVVPTPGGPIPISGEDTQYQRIGRVGVSYEYCQYSVAYADYQYGSFENDTGTLVTHRFSGGVQQNLFKFLFLRAGATIDQEGNPGFSVGAGAFFSRWGSIDLAYQHDVLPELRPDFGRSRTLQLVLSVRF